MLDRDDPRPLVERNPAAWAECDRNVKALMGPQWNACENCGGFQKGSTCANGCHLTPEQRARFAALFRAV